MSRSKKLKINGSSIKNVEVKFEEFTPPIGNQALKRVSLKVETNSDECYQYKLYVDSRAPTINYIKEYLDRSFELAIINMLNVEISEDKERRYLHTIFQTLESHQFTGERR